MQLAVREMKRARARFGLLSGAVGLLVFLILFQQALLNGLITDFIGAVDNSNSPILVLNEQARSNVEGSFLLPPQVAAITEVEGVGESSPVGESTFTASTTVEPEALDVVIFGYPLDGLGGPTALSEGRLPATSFEGVASSIDAPKGFDIGDRVTIIGETDNVEITIVGLADDSRWSVAPTIFTSFDTFEASIRAVNPDAGGVLPSFIAVAPADGVSADALTDAIDTAVPGVEALTRQEAVDQNPGVTGTRTSFQIILTLAFLVVVIVVGFFFLILTVQKSASLTLLRAIGAPKRYLVQNLLAQIALVLALGFAIGVGMTLFVVNFAPSGDVSVTVSPSTVASTLAGIAVLSMLGGFAAIRRVLRIDPIEATMVGGRI